MVWYASIVGCWPESSWLCPISKKTGWRGVLPFHLQELLSITRSECKNYPPSTAWLPMDTKKKKKKKKKKILLIKYDDLSSRIKSALDLLSPVCFSHPQKKYLSLHINTQTTDSVLKQPHPPSDIHHHGLGLGFVLSLLIIAYLANVATYRRIRACSWRCLQWQARGQVLARTRRRCCILCCHEGVQWQQGKEGYVAVYYIDEEDIADRPTGEKVKHSFAKELLAGIVGGEVDKLAETKGLDEADRLRAHEHAKKNANQMYDDRYGGYDDSGY